MNKLTYKTIRVQGADADLVKALNEAANDGWELAHILGFTSPNTAADNSWLVVMKKDK